MSKNDPVLLTQSQIADLLSTGESFFNEAGAHFENGRFDQALTALFRCAKIDVQLGLVRQRSVTLEKIAQTYFAHSNYELAKESFIMAASVRLQNAPHEDHQEAMAGLFRWIGTCCMFMGESTDAEKTFREALEWEEPLGRQEMIACILGNLANVHSSRGEFKQAEELLRKVLGIHETLKLNHAIAQDYSNLGLTRFRLGDLSSAKELWTRAISMFNELDSPSMAQTIREWVDNPQSLGTISAKPETKLN